MQPKEPLSRFVEAQDGVYARVLGELKDGRKRSHWMWFIFPQVQGLGRSTTSRRFAIQSPQEARAYLDHPILGRRLKECCEILLALEGRSAHEIFSSPDDLKLRSSMTLFAEISEPGNPFEQVLDHYFNGQRCPRTTAFLKQP